MADREFTPHGGLEDLKVLEVGLDLLAPQAPSVDPAVLVHEFGEQHPHAPHAQVLQVDAVVTDKKSRAIYTSDGVGLLKPTRSSSALRSTSRRSSASTDASSFATDVRFWSRHAM